MEKNYNSTIIKSLKQEYEIKKKDIKKRLDDFKKISKQDNDTIFYELCFCLLTPQSSAVSCDKAIQKLKKDQSIESEEKIKEALQGIRFKNNKTRYIIEAKEQFYKKDNLKHIINNPNNQESREIIVKNIKGIGYKEASHFLRNTGHGKSISILDRHILKNLKASYVIDEIPKTITKKRYIEIENKMLEFAEYISIPIEELDLLFWSKETGIIFK
ncbi:MAG: N-glycosylase/DNA lyase [DPANN group archaeon]|nr:N-glycosylase/DNA lyase [DPANN group archaeon]